MLNEKPVFLAAEKPFFFASPDRNAAVISHFSAADDAQPFLPHLSDGLQEFVTTSQANKSKHVWPELFFFLLRLCL